MDLPISIWNNIFYYLPNTDIKNVNQVSKTMQNIIADNYFLKNWLLINHPDQIIRIALKMNKLDNIIGLLKDIDIQKQLDEALCYSTKEGNLEEIKKLLKYNANIKYIAYYSFFIACSHGYDNIAKFILDNNIELHTNEEILERSFNIALYNKHIQIIKILLGYNLKIDQYMMRRAIKFSNLEIIKLLLNYFDINSDQKKLLCHAIENNNENIIDILLSFDINIPYWRNELINLSKENNYNSILELM